MTKTKRRPGGVRVRISLPGLVRDSLRAHGVAVAMQQAQSRFCTGRQRL